jgi:hypothetical protein
MKHYRCTDILPHARMRRCESSCFRNLGVERQRPLYFKGSNFLACSIDYLDQATMNRKEALFVQTADVTASKPTVNERGPIEFGGIEVATNQCGTAYQNFALLASW